MPILFFIGAHESSSACSNGPQHGFNDANMISINGF
jgi:hypothetical protein